MEQAKPQVPRYRRVLLKLSGEALMGEQGFGIDPEVVKRTAAEIAEVVKTPVIGCGGITSWRDAVEYMLAGASAVEIGTGVMYEGIEIYSMINEGIMRYLDENGFGSVKEVVGLAHRK